MLNFRNTNIALILIFALLLVLNFYYRIPFSIFLITFIIYTLILFYGSYFVDSNFYLPIICSGKSGIKEIALSFDDGPAQQYTPELLAVLKKEQVHAAFFCIGKNITGNEAIIKQIHEEGHIIGNHSFSHDIWFDLFSAKKMLNDMRSMDDAMQDTIGLRSRLFRPPYGVTNPNIKKAILQGNYIPIGWNIRSLDTVIRDENKLLSKVKAALKPGAIILFHDTSKSSLQILPELINHIRREGYTIQRLDKMLNLEPYV